MSQPYMCASCKDHFSFEQIQYSHDGKTILCKSCFAKAPKQETDKPKGFNASVEDPNIIRAICLDCHYKFKLKKGANSAPRCPYCGKSRLMRDNITVDKLLAEVSAQPN